MYITHYGFCVWNSYFSAQDKKNSIAKATHNIDGLVQDCSNSSVLAMELLQSCTKPSIFCVLFFFINHMFCSVNVNKKSENFNYTTFVK